MDHEDHIRGLGLLVSYFQALEFALRAVCKNNEIHKMYKINYSTLKAGDSVPVDAMTNYDSLGTLIEKYNTLTTQELRIDIGLVAIRDALAHGRVFSDTPTQPMRLFKFEKPKNGMTTVSFAETLDQDWFFRTSIHVYHEVEKAMKTNNQFY